MAKWSVYRWGKDPKQQNGKLVYEGEDEGKARREFTNLAVNGLSGGGAVRLYCDGRCVDDVATVRGPGFAA
jgi:hypothetical protein